MLYSTYEFIFIFLPIVCIVYFSLSGIKSAVPQHLFLVLASLYFYGYFNPSYLIIIIASVLVNYALAMFMTKRRELDKIIFSFGILFNIGMLIYFKYMDFFIENINSIANTGFSSLDILLPLGISFFTFQQFSFLLSVLKYEEEVETFIDYFLFVTFFPQLVAGPIVLYSEMMTQFKDQNRRKIDVDNVAIGIYIFVLGLFKKIVIADTLSVFVNNGFETTLNLGLLPAWIISLSYTFQIYFDFSGYCDMAIGIGKIFNIDLPMNFNSPYKSKSITEFWKRWHMTLGRALANYIYIPLGGSRKGAVRTYTNLFITFLVSGLWHGAAWSFVLWGVLHGFFSILDRVFSRIVIKVPNVLRVASTFLIVNFLWVLFRASSMSEAYTVYKGMFNFNNLGISQISSIVSDGIIGFPSIINITIVTVMLSFSALLAFRFNNTLEKSKSFMFTIKSAVYLAIVFLVSVIHLSRVSPFIYFNF